MTTSIPLSAPYQPTTNFQTTPATPDPIRIETNIDLLSKLFALKTTKHSPFHADIDRRACVAVILRIRPKNDPLAITLPHLNYYHHLHPNYYSHIHSAHAELSLTPNQSTATQPSTLSTYTPPLAHIIPQPLVPSEFFIDTPFPTPAAAPHHPSFTPLNQTKWLSQPWVNSGDLEVCFIKRAYNPRDRWSAQIGFPGGRKEKGESDIQTAIREVAEEVGLDLANPQQYTYISRLDDLQIESYKSTQRLAVSTFVFLQLTPITPTLYLEPKEVAQILWTPLRLFGIGVNNIPKQPPLLSAATGPKPTQQQQNMLQQLPPPQDAHSIHNSPATTPSSRQLTSSTPTPSGELLESSYPHSKGLSSTSAMPSLILNDHLQTVSLTMLTQLASLLESTPIAPHLPPTHTSTLPPPNPTNSLLNSPHHPSTSPSTPVPSGPPKVVTTKFSQLKPNQLLDMSPLSAQHTIQSIWHTNPSSSSRFNRGLQISKSHLAPQPQQPQPQQQQSQLPGPSAPPSTQTQIFYPHQEHFQHQQPLQPKPYTFGHCLYRLVTFPSRLMNSIFSSLFYSTRSAFRHWLTPRYQITGLEKIYLKSFQISFPHFVSSPPLRNNSNNNLLGDTTQLTAIQFKAGPQNNVKLGQIQIPFEIVYCPKVAMHRYVWRHRIDTAQRTTPQLTFPSSEQRLTVQQRLDKESTHTTCLHSVLFSIVNNRDATPSCDDLLEILGDVPILPFKEFDHVKYLPRSRDFVHFLSPELQTWTKIIPPNSTTFVKPVTATRPLTTAVTQQLIFQSKLIHYLPNHNLTVQQHSQHSLSHALYPPRTTQQQQQQQSRTPTATIASVYSLDPVLVEESSVLPPTADPVYVDPTSTESVETTLHGEQMESLLKDEKDEKLSSKLPDSSPPTTTPEQTQISQIPGQNPPSALQKQNTMREISSAKPLSEFMFPIKFPCLLLPGVGLRTLNHIPPLKPTKKSPPPTPDQIHHYALQQQINQLPFITLGTPETMLWGMTFRNISNFCMTMNAPVLKTLIDYDNDWRRYVLNLYFRWDEFKSSSWFGKKNPKPTVKAPLAAKQQLQASTLTLTPTNQSPPTEPVPAKL